MKTIKKIKTTKKKPTLEKKKTTLKPIIKKQSLKKTAPKKNIATKKAIKKPKEKKVVKAVSKPSRSKMVKPIRKTVTTAKVKNTVPTKPKIRAGEFANINAESAHGHLGVVTKRYKNGKMDAITTTHSKKYPKHKKIKLEENPNPKERDRTSYLNKRVHKNVTDKDIGTRRPNVRIKNAVDKSKLRKLKTITKRKK